MHSTDKLTEDETIRILLNYLTMNGWEIDSHCLGQKKGIDIIASRAQSKLNVEVKGARAGDNSPNKKRTSFDSGQIKTHFGKAIVKVLEDKIKYPNYEFAIAHPNDTSIKKAIGNLIPFLNELGIKHFWVSRNGDIDID